MPYICPNGCEPTDMYGNTVDTPFYLPACSVQMCPGGEKAELGILVYRSGQLSNRWEDGTAGIDQALAKEAQDLMDQGSLPHCIDCHEEGSWVAMRNRDMFPPDDICLATGKRHRPDWKGITMENEGKEGGATFIDVPCLDCGRSGCLAKVDHLEENVCW